MGELCAVKGKARWVSSVQSKDRPGGWGLSSQRTGQVGVVCTVNVKGR